ncbi:sporulation membrane protein YtaF [Calderihabitans maritimus]|uniref:Sporulation protein YtaF n=1 Tax=Calderihabitans maritimus TaxID=1246530 RepID=A0A1Z5HSV3_9FIRM|nr:sporulation membrane protein YtaF [Calderihabitans maritimus]GAW92401.1 sporulation protein YtaF [Calderihabitans maritimus]
MQLWSSVLFALAVSLDGLGVGFSYGLRRIIVPWYSLLVISLASAAAITFSMFFGYIFSLLISHRWAEITGAVILISMGCWIIVGTWNNWSGRNTLKEYSLVKLRISPLGIVIQILKEPVRADFDRSGIINLPESLALGLALAMDALGAGFGAAVAGLHPLLTPLLVGVFKFWLLSAGIYGGRAFAVSWLGEKSGLIPGIILILLGLWKI